MDKGPAPWMEFWSGRLPKAQTIHVVKPQLKAYRRERGVQALQKTDWAEAEGGAKKDAEYKAEFDVEPSALAKNLSQRKFLDVNQVVFIVHGFANNIDATWMQEMKNALLEVADQTVILVGWGDGVSGCSYYQAVANTELVGEWLSAYATAIKKSKTTVSLYGVGHCLGAHVLGIAGRSSAAFRRITGLDPAALDLQFEDKLKDKCLRSTDAKVMVDVIHTCGCSSIKEVTGPYHYGSFTRMGTVDFYPNYGHEQPGTDIATGGSHKRALELFTWTIKNKGQLKTNRVLTRIPSPENLKPASGDRLTWYEMGYHADAEEQVPTGLYLIDTAPKAPWMAKRS